MDNSTNNQATQLPERPSLRSRVPLLALNVIVICTICINIWWISEFRQGYPLNIDEAGYITFALNDAAAFSRNGFEGLRKQFLLQGLQAPFVPLVTVPFYLLLGERIFPSFLVQQCFLVILAYATYAIGRRIANPWFGALAAIGVITTPGITDFSRSYHFAVPSAALLTLATFAFMQSEAFRVSRWAIVGGLVMGLALLTRTMMIVFIPGIVFSAALQLAGVAGPRIRRTCNFLAATALGFATAATWYFDNYHEVLVYLTSFGYGQQSQYYAESGSSLGMQLLTNRFHTMVEQGTYIPFATVIMVTLMASLFALFGRLRRTRVSKISLLRSLSSDIGTLFIVFGFSYLALSSSLNEGTGFILPLIPILILISVSLIARLPYLRLRSCLIASFLVVSAFNLGMKADVVPALSGKWMLAVPALGILPVVDGRGDIHRVLEAAGYSLPISTAHLPAEHLGWFPTTLDVATWLVTFAHSRGKDPIVFFGSRDPLFNVNTLTLAGRAYLARSLSVGQLEATAGDTPDAYRARLASPASGPANFVITGERALGEYPPYVTQSVVEIAAQSLGFELVASYRLPDGREAKVWWRNTGPPATGMPGSARSASLQFVPAGLN